MPDNSMLFYQIPSIEKCGERLRSAEEKLVQIKENIDKRYNENIKSSTILSDLVGAGYKLCNKTAKFYANENCIGCGLCAKGCPQDVIVMKNDKPDWIKPTCAKCSACINRCPKWAIQYGNATKNVTDM